MSAKLFEVIEEHSFVGRLEELKKAFSRIYDVKDAVCWLLAKNPLYGTELPDIPNHRILETKPLSVDCPRFWILYRIDKAGGKIFLLSIAIVPSSGESASP